ncbi:hypothetical protein [Anaerobaca lacustris]|uniref:SGNH hydrolase-type esterase domain-containing protein n=1 Tax=Anaerobaca lacustris TaxID=3044600 RepID=A0AAW6TVP5_9BACT|nr:hypothetical protein [Sedimentisphaerales bacterium M17dextr]
MAAERTDQDGRLYDGMTVDGLHLSPNSYQLWADALKPILTERLGSPADEDHAPPPIGDPSAALKRPWETLLNNSCHHSPIAVKRA